MKKYLYLAFPALFAAATLNAQNISLVKDMNDGRIGEFKECNGNVYYSTSFNVSSSLWKTDGTPAGTSQLANFTGHISGLTSYNNHVFFIAPSPSYGYQLYVSDGTPAGTKVVKYISPHNDAFDYNNNYYSANQIRVLNGKMYFMANDDVHGTELWQSDGTDSGTVLVKDINPLPNVGSPDLQARGSFEVANGKLFFSASDSNGHNGLWTSDGTASGTVFVKAIYSDSYRPFNNKICMDGHCLDPQCPDFGAYISDGTDTGTRLILPDCASQCIDYAILNNKLYFLSRDFTNPNLQMYYYGIYGTDGTAQGTFHVKDSLQIPSGVMAGGRLIQLTALNNKLYFSLGELWQSDGTAQGTSLLKDLTPYNVNGGTSPFQSNVNALTLANGKIYFKAQDSVSSDLWVTDGTDTGTRKIIGPNGQLHKTPLQRFQDLWPPMFAYNNTLLFDHMYDTTIGQELYKIDVPASVPSIKSITNASLFPNPATDFISVQGLKVNKFAVADITGKVLIIANTERVNISVLAPGMYIAEIITNDGERLASKFLKQ